VVQQSSKTSGDAVKDLADAAVVPKKLNLIAAEFGGEPVALQAYATCMQAGTEKP
jgi:hypothetical protein